MMTEDNNFICFEFNSFDEAMEIHKKIFKNIREQHFISYATVYEMIYNKKPDKIKKNSGWINVFGSKVEPKGDCLDTWVLKIPNNLIIKEKE